MWRLTSFALFAVACAAPTPKPAAEAIYLGQQLRCVEEAQTRKGADECLAAVRLAWAKDSGAE